MKKTYYVTFLAVVAIITVAVMFGSQKANANPSIIGVGALSANGQGISSSTATFLLNTAATTTLVIGTVDSDQVDLNLYYVASTSAGVLNFQIDFSDDTNCYVESNCNWYREDVNTISGSVVTHSAKTFHIWAPLSAATSTKNITVGGIGAKFMRVGFAAGSNAGVNGTLWVQTANKIQAR